MNHFAIFGTHPRLSLAEFRAINPNLPRPTLVGAAGLFEATNWNGAELMRILGGTVKLGDLFFETSIEEFSVDQVVEALTNQLPDHAIDFGWTVYGGSRQMNQRCSKLAIPFKKALKARGTSSRWVTSKEGDISPAAVAKLKLTTEGLDLCLFLHEKNVFIGRTTHVQDADAWSLRDFGRPGRDEIVGMLPPKLARMMVNLGQLPSGGTLWDPFCGGGTVLMEAALATDAKRLIGSDIDATQTRNTERNTAWLIEQHIFQAQDAQRITIFQADARTAKPSHQGKVDAVVTEGYLGPPLTGQETRQTLERNVKEISQLWLETLRSIKPLLADHARIVGIWPAFKTSHGTARVEIDREVETEGYRVLYPLEGWDESQGPLLYARPDQRVMRRIVILEKMKKA